MRQSTSSGAFHFHFISSRFVYIAIQEALDGKVVDWMEQVSEAQYGGKE